MNMPREKRDAPITVQLTATEKSAAVAAAEERGVAASTLLRNIVREWLAVNAKKIDQT